MGIFWLNTYEIATIIVSINLVESEHGSWQYILRWVLNITNGLVIFGLLLPLEIRQMINMKANYLKNFHNYNDVLYILLYLSTMICDYKLGVDNTGYGEVTRILYSVLIVCGFIRWMAVA